MSQLRKLRKKHAPKALFATHQGVSEQMGLDAYVTDDGTRFVAAPHAGHPLEGLWSAVFDRMKPRAIFTRYGVVQAYMCDHIVDVAIDLMHSDHPRRDDAADLIMRLCTHGMRVAAKEGLL